MSCTLPFIEEVENIDISNTSNIRCGEFAENTFDSFCFNCQAEMRHRLMAQPFNNKNVLK